MLGKVDHARERNTQVGVGASADVRELAAWGRRAVPWKLHLAERRASTARSAIRESVPGAAQGVKRCGPNCLEAVPIRSGSPAMLVARGPRGRSASAVDRGHQPRRASAVQPARRRQVL